MSTAVIFPGQGSQSVGMGKDLTARALSEVDKILGYALTDIMFNGPEEKLKLTENTQPALLTHSIALWDTVREKTGLKPEYFAGHSLGEYTALVAAGGLSFPDAVLAVHNRGRFMQSAVPVGIGGMMAVLGGKEEDIVTTCKEVSTDTSIVEPANFNTIGQVVVAGHLDALERFSAAMKEKGAKRIISLPVSAPFHCSLMKPAQAEMQRYLDNIIITPLFTPVINNVDAVLETEPGVIRQALIKQMSGAVKWTQSVQKLIELGVHRFIEIGSGSVLTGLIKKINKEVECINISTLSDVDKLS